MVASLLVCGAALRVGMRLRRSRRFGAGRERGAREAHLRVAKFAVAMIAIGFVAGEFSAIWLRDWAPFQTFHAWIGGLTLFLFAIAAGIGRRLERGQTRAFDAHALAGLLAMLAAMVAAVAGVALTP